MRIVIAEDEGITRQWLNKSVELLGEEYYICGLFSNGLQALEYCLANKVDVVITDIQMPVMDGLTMIERLKKKKPGLPVIVLSAYDQFAYARQAIRLGVIEFILKPEITRKSLGECLVRIQDTQKHHDPVKNDTVSSALLSLEQKAYMTKVFEYKSERDGSAIQEELDRLSVKLHEKELFALIYKTCSDEQKILDMSALLLGTLGNIGVCYQYSENVYIIVGNACMEHASKLAGELLRLLQTHTDQQIYMGLSRIKDGYSCFSDLFREAEIASEFCVFFDIQEWRSYEELSQNFILSDGYVLLSKRNEEIQSLIQNSAYEEAFKKVRVMLTQIGQEKVFPPPVVKSLMIELLAMFIQKLRTYDLTKEEASSLGSVDLSQASEKQTLVELADWWMVSVQKLITIFKNRGRLYSSTVQSIIAYISDNYSGHIHLDELAKLVHLNRSYVSTLFKKETGESLSDYILKIRIEKACSQLKYSTQNITTISEECGFTDITYFSRTFKKLKDMPPSAYREKINRK